MKVIKKIGMSCLIPEIVTTVVCEKSDLVWTVPFTPELHELIVDELFVRFPISEN